MGYCPEIRDWVTSLALVGGLLSRPELVRSLPRSDGVSLSRDQRVGYLPRDLSLPRNHRVKSLLRDQRVMSLSLDQRVGSMLRDQRVRSFPRVQRVGSLPDLSD